MQTPNPCLCDLFYKTSKFLSVPGDTVGHCTSIFVLPSVATRMKSSFPASYPCCLFDWHTGTGDTAWFIGTNRAGAFVQGLCHQQSIPAHTCMKSSNHHQAVNPRLGSYCFTSYNFKKMISKEHIVPNLEKELSTLTRFPRT